MVLARLLTSIRNNLLKRSKVIPDPERVPESFFIKYYLYILTNYTNTVLYLGVTNNLKRRILEHKNGLNEGFTKKYKCKKLIWFEEFSDIKFAIEKEKQMKKWKREFKENLINEINPNWDDLYTFIYIPVSHLKIYLRHEPE